MLLTEIQFRQYNTFGLRALYGSQYVEMVKEHKRIPLAPRGINWFAYPKNNQITVDDVIKQWHLELYATNNYISPGIIIKMNINIQYDDNWAYFPKGWGGGCEYGIIFSETLDFIQQEQIYNHDNFRKRRNYRGEMFYPILPIRKIQGIESLVDINGLVYTKPISRYEIVKIFE